MHHHPRLAPTRAQAAIDIRSISPNGYRLLAGRCFAATYSALPYDERRHGYFESSEAQTGRRD